ncbi:hypothetical protein BSK59_13855 [Paenibacillus odorifer]|uniref:hypothetical protein n=1 Tax=Paenibacillus odorifer TaxID=189426 RepID=UPI00096F3A5B|nr:hypothetical protein [Paenibacillus odorifer]OME55555.1 hypothetical protein BSK59_13855 [Paenibacillus odorifer]
MKTEKYAVLEWQNGDQEDAFVIGEDLSLETAQTMIKIAPSHLYREFITMSILESIRSEELEEH